MNSQTKSINQSVGRKTQGSLRKVVKSYRAITASQNVAYSPKKQQHAISQKLTSIMRHQEISQQINEQISAPTSGNWNKLVVQATGVGAGMSSATVSPFGVIEPNSHSISPRLAHQQKTFNNNNSRTISSNPLIRMELAEVYQNAKKQVRKQQRQRINSLKQRSNKKATNGIQVHGVSAKHLYER